MTGHDTISERKHTIYIQSNIEAPSHTLCSYGQTIIIKYNEIVSVCVCVCVFFFCACIRVFFTRHANRTFSVPYYAVIRILSGTTIFFYIISQKPGFSEIIIDHKLCFDFLYNFV